MKHHDIHKDNVAWQIRDDDVLFCGTAAKANVSTRLATRGCTVGRTVMTALSIYHHISATRALIPAPSLHRGVVRRQNRHETPLALRQCISHKPLAPRYPLPNHACRRPHFITGINRWLYYRRSTPCERRRAMAISVSRAWHRPCPACVKIFRVAGQPISCAAAARRDRAIIRATWLIHCGRGRPQAIKRLTMRIDERAGRARQRPPNSRQKLAAAASLAADADEAKWR